MNVKVLEDEKEKLLLEFNDETETITNLLASQVWEENGKAAAVREHPFIENPKLVIIGRNPKRLLKKASASLEGQCEDLKEEFKRALEK